jgi:hypothetical protein
MLCGINIIEEGASLYFSNFQTAMALNRVVLGYWID